jgi:2,4-dichlorophenol 6-monooxygenase
MDGGVEHDKIRANMDARCDAGAAAEAQRKALREAIAFKKYEFDAHGVEMNQRYSSGAVETDGQPEPAFGLDKELHYQPTTWPGARLPHAWVFDASGAQHSTLDLCGRGQFTLLTGIGGEAWRDAAAKMDIPIRFHVIGPRQAFVDYTGDWARLSEIGDTGAVLVRPDHHVAWRCEQLPEDPEADLKRVLKKVLAL